ncbi:hypothetical protein, partial [Eubacterium coprostanoligenes]|uniref:hypothetical protein n=1 Tax=Eubacterium coprostanoligenes TaxID=290054 RepID=UPI0023578D47
NSNTSLIKTADNVMISLRYAPFHHHIVIFPTLFYFRFLGVTSLTNEQQKISSSDRTKEEDSYYLYNFCFTDI